MRHYYRTSERYRLYRRDLDYALRYGITLGEYDALFAKQNGVCAICKEPEVSRSNNGSDDLRRLAIDHDHETGEVRGLLCTACNAMIGQAKEDPVRLRAAIDYLTQL